MDSVNTAKKISGKWEFFSTDFLGFVRALTRIGVDIFNVQDVIILGSGGAVSSILDGCNGKHSGKFHIFRRRPDRDEHLVKTFNSLNICFYDFEAEIFGELLNNQRHSLVVQATPLPQYGDPLSYLAEQVPSHFRGGYYDLTYNCPNGFRSKFENLGLAYGDGLSMLIEQARESQMIWWGQSAFLKR